MLEKALSQKELSALLGMTTFEIYKKLCWQIEADYDMEHIWNKGGSCWRYEYKYRRGGRTLCGLYLRESCLGFMVILGKAEREKPAAGQKRRRTVYDVGICGQTTRHDPRC